ncbi:uncharacterized protein LOC105632009 isoform X2 [Jatropha curcas]|uniref:uncharacterized protein LOC105632009 isoform X2 n=1 Tax=Jatropha curcas TaxID=180498 RepID=UPI0009D78568|nr:uncharacterized protein LOC105632009 isoform X2 [Jatropha curcas]
MAQGSFTQANLQEGADEFSDISLRLLDVSDIDDFMVWTTDERVGKDICRGLIPWMRKSSTSEILNGGGEILDGSIKMCNNDFS